VPLAVLVLAGWHSRVEVLRAGEETSIRAAAVMHEHAVKVFETIELTLARTLDHVRGLDWDTVARPETSEFLRELKAPMDQIVSVWVTDATGTVRAGSRPWPPGANIGDRDFFKAQQESANVLHVSVPFSGRATARPSFAVSRRKPTADGRFDGIVHVAVSTEYFERFFADMAPPVGHIATLVRGDGTVLARDPGHADGTRLDATSGLMQAIRRAPQSGFFAARSPIDEKERLVAYRKVGDYPVYVAFGTDTSALLGRWHRQLAIYAVVAVAAAAILLVFAVLALRRARAEQEAIARLRHETEQRHAAEAALRQAQKMEAIGQLTGGVAHDFNNLLSVVAGNAELLLVGSLGDRQKRLVAAIARAAERGESLTRQLLAFSRRQPLEGRVFDLNGLIGDMMDLLARSLRADIGVRTELAADAWPVIADPNQVELALLNLAVNARDAMPDGGSLVIATKNVNLDRPDLAGDFVALLVRDSGVGMTEDQSERAFEPFFTTKDRGRGTGLGLSTVYGFLKQSGGGAEIVSRQGEGTTVTLYLPRAAAPVHAGGRRAAAAPVAATRPDILLVEDDDDVAEALAEQLSELGHPVTRLGDGAAAHRLLSTGAPGLRLVISDMYMPGALGGLDLARRLRRERPDIRVLLITGGYEPAERAQDEGFEVLMKPFKRAELAAALAGATAAAL